MQSAFTPAAAVVDLQQGPSLKFSRKSSDPHKTIVLKVVGHRIKRIG
ncbi:MAG: hypothetical protein ACOYLU_06880 [Limisphaerales bacterium]